MNKMGISKKRNYKNNQTKILEMKNIIELKNLLVLSNSRLEHAEGRIRKLEKILSLRSRKKKKRKVKRESLAKCIKNAGFDGILSQKTQFRSKNTHRLKTKGWKSIPCK